MALINTKIEEEAFIAFKKMFFLSLKAVGCVKEIFWDSSLDFQDICKDCYSCGTDVDDAFGVVLLNRQSKWTLSIH